MSYILRFKQYTAKVKVVWQSICYLAKNGQLLYPRRTFLETLPL